MDKFELHRGFKEFLETSVDFLHPQLVNEHVASANHILLNTLLQNFMTTSCRP